MADASDKVTIIFCIFILVIFKLVLEYGAKVRKKSDKPWLNRTKFVLLHRKMTFMDNIYEALRQRILILDGAMGTKIQTFGLGADDFHRGRFAGWPVSLAGNNDVLTITRPDVIANIHRTYIEAGADIISTNTFSSNRISQHEYGCSDEARTIAFEGARLAKRVADEACPKKVWVAGSMGPTAKSLTLASDMSQPAHRIVSFDEMVDSYREQAQALLEGGADFLLLETCYDALNTKAALAAISDLHHQRPQRTNPHRADALGILYERQPLPLPAQLRTELFLRRH